MTTHKRWNTPEYHAWREMRARCRNKKHRVFMDYGGRGITVCRQWENFSDFLADMGERPSPDHQLERIDNDKGYKPGNCKWATCSEQSNNRRSNRFITFAGKRLTLAQWSYQLGGSRHLIKDRLTRGWPLKKALTTPLDKTKRHGGGA